MGITNGEKVDTRREEEERHVHPDTGGNRTTGNQGEISWHQQKRANRTDSKEPSIFGSGSSVTGGMLRQLISDYRDQKAAKQNEIRRIEEEKQRLDEQKNRLEDEAKKLQARIEEFESLQKDLDRSIAEKS